MTRFRRDNQPAPRRCGHHPRRCPRHISPAVRLPSNRGVEGIPRSLSVLLFGGNTEVIPAKLAPRVQTPSAKTPHPRLPTFCRSRRKSHRASSSPAANHRAPRFQDISRSVLKRPPIQPPSCHPRHVSPTVCGRQEPQRSPPPRLAVRD